jgi:hypothetical protein
MQSRFLNPATRLHSHYSDMRLRGHATCQCCNSIRPITHYNTQTEQPSCQLNDTLEPTRLLAGHREWLRMAPWEAISTTAAQ